MTCQKGSRGIHLIVVFEELSPDFWPAKHLFPLWVRHPLARGHLGRISLCRSRSRSIFGVGLGLVIVGLGVRGSTQAFLEGLPVHVPPAGAALPRVKVDRLEVEVAKELVLRQEGRVRHLERGTRDKSGSEHFFPSSSLSLVGPIFSVHQVTKRVFIRISFFHIFLFSHFQPFSAKLLK